MQQADDCRDELLQPDQFFPSARTGASLIRVGASADFRKSIVMEFRTARGNDREGFEVLRLVGGHRLLLSRGSNRRGFGLR